MPSENAPDWKANYYAREFQVHLSLSETALASLAMERAENTKLAILEHDENLQDRVNILENKSVAKQSGEMIKMKVSLATGESG